MPVRARVAATLASWAAAELRPWRNSRLDRETVEARLREEARRNGQVCLFRIVDGEIDFATFTRLHRPFLLDPAHSGGARARLYLDHLRMALRTHDVRGSALIGVFVADSHLAGIRAPVFCYQKPAGSRGLLLPDVDLLGGAIDPDETDSPFETKRAAAIFVGATTGTDVLTEEIVARRGNPRIDAALFFRGCADIVFRLPAIVQCDGEATRAAIAALDIGGRRWRREEQRAFRYMLSIDGNGATCGRVATALHARQVLAKYASPNGLYYFRGLVPWRHYIPIVEHRDVIDMVANAEADLPLHRSIAERSRRFARRFLTRAPITHYSAALLSAYIARFGASR